MDRGAGSLSRSTFDGLHNHMAWWQDFFLAQKRFEKRRDPNRKPLNYNSQFLIVYVRDLIASIPIEQTMVAKMARRATSLGSAAVHLVPWFTFGVSLMCYSVYQKSAPGGDIAQSSG
jgi:hypothetical protein